LMSTLIETFWNSIFRASTKKRSTIAYVLYIYMYFTKVHTCCKLFIYVRRPVFTFAKYDPRGEIWPLGVKILC
jgi:hypothetical protein